MERWVAQRDTFLRHLTACEQPPSSRACVQCGGTMMWQCDDCFGRPTYCQGCCRETHTRLPFHRVRMWNGKTFCKSSLRKTGLILYLGHGGAPCPMIHQYRPFYLGHRNLPSQPVHHTSTQDDSHNESPCAETSENQEFLELFGLTSLLSLNTSAGSHECGEGPPPSIPQDRTDSTHGVDSSEVTPLSTHPAQSLATLELPDHESDDEYFEFETGGLKSNVLRFPKGYDHQGNQWMTITDITGVHSLPVHFCSCADCLPPHLQLLDLGIYPVTYDRPQSGFTFRLLDDFDLENLETKCSAQSYYEKLRRLTSNTYPYLVPNRYREFMTCARQWRNLNQHKRAGTLFDSQSDSKKGRLATFCPACPQPGVNLPADWEKDKQT